MRLLIVERLALRSGLLVALNVATQRQSGAFELAANVGVSSLQLVADPQRNYHVRHSVVKT